MEIPKALRGPARIGLAVAEMGFAAAEQTAATAREAVQLAADQLEPEADRPRRENLVTAVQRLPYIVHRVSDLISPGSAVDRLVGAGGAADRVADLFEQGGAVDRVIRHDGPLDRATREGGIVETLTAEEGVVQRLAEMTDALNKLTPTISAMNARIGDIENVVGVANTVTEPVTDLLSSLPKFALRTASDVARAAQGPRVNRQAPAPAIVDVEADEIEQ